MTGQAIFAPKYIPAEIMRKMTKDQLKLVATQKKHQGQVFPECFERPEDIMAYKRLYV